jgi:hypothetical protein
MENNAKKSGKAGYIITIIFLILVIIVLSILFAFKETIFPVAKVANTVDTNTLISNDTIENTLATENTIAQNQAKLVNSVKGYWIATTGDLFLAITDTTDSLGKTSTNFSLTGNSGITYTTCTIDSTKITCDGKIYNYIMQGNNLILSYDNVTRNFIPSNYYQLSKQSKIYYANIMGYSLGTTQIPDGVQITGDYINKSLLGTWESSSGNEQLVFTLKNNNLVVSKTNKSTREILSDLPVGMTQTYIEFVNNSSLSNEEYKYQLKDAKTLILSNIVGDGFTEYTKVSDEQTPQLVITDEE